MRHKVYLKRPCRVCRRWYRPNPKLGDRQRTCGDDKCKREWNRRLCAARRCREGDRDRENRLRDRIQAVDSAQVGGEPDRALNQFVVRHSIGLEAFVVVDEYARVTREWVRHAFPLQLPVRQGKSQQLLPFRARHSMEDGRPPS
jgi:hypothetical protein